MTVDTHNVESYAPGSSWQKITRRAKAGERLLKMKSYLPSIQKLARRLGMPAIHETAGLDAIIPYLEIMRAEGAVVVLKLHGERGPALSRCHLAPRPHKEPCS